MRCYELQPLLVQTKVACPRCKKLILPMTASRTGGLCMRCVGLPDIPAYADPPRGIGYWRGADSGHDARFPDPSALVRHNWIPPESRIRLLRYLRSAPVFSGSWGHSCCRFGCGASNNVMGSHDYWDGVWVWPEGLVHYVECHDVCLPDQFVQRAASLPVPDILGVPAFPGINVNWDYWLEWSDPFRIE